MRLLTGRPPSLALAENELSVFAVAPGGRLLLVLGVGPVGLAHYSRDELGLISLEVNVHVD